MATHRILLSTRINLDEVNFPHSRKSDIISPHSFQLPLPLFSSSSRGHTPLLPVPSLAKTCMDSSKRFWQKRLKAYKFLMWWICCCFSLSESSFISWKESRIRRRSLTQPISTRYQMISWNMYMPQGTKQSRGSDLTDCPYSLIISNYAIKTQQDFYKIPDQYSWKPSGSWKTRED